MFSLEKANLPTPPQLPYPHHLFLLLSPPPFPQNLVCSSVFISRSQHTHAALKAFVTFTSRSDLLAALTLDRCCQPGPRGPDATVSPAAILAATPFTQACHTLPAILSIVFRIVCRNVSHFFTFFVSHVQQSHCSSLPHYLDSIPTLGWIVNLRSAVARSLLPDHARHISSSIKPHVSLSSGQVAPSRHSCLRLLALSGLHFRLLSQMFAPASTAPSGCPSFASSVLRHVVAKLAAATPEVEAASVVAWCRQAAEDELPLDHDFYSWSGERARSQTEYAAAAMSHLAASTNGRLALVSCGACETLIDVMLLQDKRHSVHGCQKQSSDCQRNKCICDELSCYSHRSYVCAALALEGCAAGAYTLNHRTCWNPNWQVVVSPNQTHTWIGRGWVEDGVITELMQQAVTVPPVVVHFADYPKADTISLMCNTGECVPCHCELLESRCPLAEPVMLEFSPARPSEEQAVDKEDEMGRLKQFALIAL